MPAFLRIHNDLRFADCESGMRIDDSGSDLIVGIVASLSHDDGASDMVESHGLASAMVGGASMPLLIASSRAARVWCTQ